MNRKAYALLAFNHMTGQILGWSVYSSDEGGITCSRHVRYARLSEAEGVDFEDARGKAIAAVRAWCPGLGEPSR